MPCGFRRVAWRMPFEFLAGWPGGRLLRFWPSGPVDVFRIFGRVARWWPCQFLAEWPGGRFLNFWPGGPVVVLFTPLAKTRFFGRVARWWWWGVFLSILGSQLGCLDGGWGERSCCQLLAPVVMRWGGGESIKPMALGQGVWEGGWELGGWGCWDGVGLGGWGEVGSEHQAKFTLPRAAKLGR